MTVIVENVSDLASRMKSRATFEWHCALHYPWVIVNKDTGTELDAYASWEMAQRYADRANIYSHRTGSARQYVVRYEGPVKRLIMSALRGVLGRHV